MLISFKYDAYVDLELNKVHINILMSDQIVYLKHAMIKANMYVIN
jgi:hypothetical protein